MIDPPLQSRNEEIDAQLNLFSQLPDSSDNKKYQK